MTDTNSAEIYRQAYRKGLEETRRVQDIIDRLGQVSRGLERNLWKTARLATAQGSTGSSKSRQDAEPVKLADLPKGDEIHTAVSGWWLMRRGLDELWSKVGSEDRETLSQPEALDVPLTKP
jgi:hypothetical protein